MAQFVPIMGSVKVLIPEAMKRRKYSIRNLMSVIRLKKALSGDIAERTEQGTKKLNEKEYDAICSDYEKRYGYDSRSNKEKATFDKKFDEHYQADKRVILEMMILPSKIKKLKTIVNMNVADVVFVKLMMTMVDNCLDRQGELIWRSLKK